MRIFFTLLLIFCGFIVSIFSQEKPKAELVDEFGKTSCEDLIARQDYLFYQLQNEPDSMAYVVIYGDKNNAKFAWAVKSYLNGQTAFRKYDKNKLIIVKAKDEDALRVQFWKVSLGAEKPDFQEVGWNYDVSTKKKAFRLNSTIYENLDVCPSGNKIEDFSKYLNFNKDFRGHIVIYTDSNFNFQKEKAEFLDQLTRKYNVSSKQIRFFFMKQKTDNYYYELWLVPNKKK